MGREFTSILMYQSFFCRTAKRRFPGTSLAGPLSSPYNYTAPAQGPESNQELHSSLSSAIPHPAGPDSPFLSRWVTVSRLIGPKRSDERFGEMGRTREMGGGEEPKTFLGARVTFLRHSYSKCFKLGFELLLILKFCAHSAQKIALL